MYTRVFLLSAICVSTVGCSDLEFRENPGSIDNGGAGTSSFGNSVSTNSGTVTMEWDKENARVYQEGVGSKTLTTFYEQYGHTYCFENSRYGHDCEVAPSDIRSVISSEPVAIQGLQLNFSKTSQNRTGAAASYSNVHIEAAWVKTAEIGFSSIDGELKLTNHSTKVIHGSAETDCDLNDMRSSDADVAKQTIGYFDGTKVLTGLYLADEYSVNTAAYYNAHMTSARIHASGLAPDPKIAQKPGDSGIYSWRFVRSNEAAAVDLGIKSFDEALDSNQVAVTNHFGWDSNDSISRWDSHVIVGFCIKGYKEFSDGYKRPLIHYLIARTHEPKLVFRRR